MKSIEVTIALNNEYEASFIIKESEMYDMMTRLKDKKTQWINIHELRRMYNKNNISYVEFTPLPKP